MLVIAPVEKIMIDKQSKKQSYEKGTFWCG